VCSVVQAGLPAGVTGVSSSDFLSLSLEGPAVAQSHSSLGGRAVTKVCSVGQQKVGLVGTSGACSCHPTLSGGCNYRRWSFRPSGTAGAAGSPINLTAPSP
jgi:hypothetical protein